MKGMGGEGEDCPFEFNFDPATFKVGDTVRIQECAPISKLKRWTVLADGK